MESWALCLCSGCDPVISRCIVASTSILRSTDSTGKHKRGFTAYGAVPGRNFPAARRSRQQRSCAAAARPGRRRATRASRQRSSPSLRISFGSFSLQKRLPFRNPGTADPVGVGNLAQRLPARGAVQDGARSLAVAPLRRQVILDLAPLRADNVGADAIVEALKKRFPTSSAKYFRQTVAHAKGGGRL